MEPLLPTVGPVFLGEFTDFSSEMWINMNSLLLSSRSSLELTGTLSETSHQCTTHFNYLGF